MASEKTQQRKMWLELSTRFMSRLFRVNTGRAYLSGMGPKGVVRYPDGSVMIQAARPVSLGFALPTGEPLNGTADLNGWTPITITQDMVGHVVGVYTAIESKASSGGRVSADQRNFIAQVQASGGIAGKADSPEEACGVIEGWFQRFSQKSL